MRIFRDLKEVREYINCELMGQSLSYIIPTELVIAGHRIDSIVKNQFTSRPRLKTDDGEILEMAHLEWNEVRLGFELLASWIEQDKYAQERQELIIRGSKYLGTYLQDKIKGMNMPGLAVGRYFEDIKWAKLGVMPDSLLQARRICELGEAVDNVGDKVSWFESITEDNYKELSTAEKKVYHRLMYYRTLDKTQNYLESMWDEAIDNGVEIPVESGSWKEHTLAAVAWLHNYGINKVYLTVKSTALHEQICALIDAGWNLVKHEVLEKRYGIHEGKYDNDALLFECH